MPAVTALYAGLAGLLLLALAVSVIRLRQRHLVGLGDGGHADLRRAIRAHANFAEYTPLALLLMALIELLGAPAWLLHGFGVALVVGRVLHAIGLYRTDERSFGRAAGVLLTFAVISLASVYAIWSSVAG